MITRIFALALICTGCASVELNGAETKTTNVDYPIINTIATASLGDELVKKGQTVEEKILQVNKTIDGVAYDIPKAIYPQIGYNENNDYFSASGVILGLFADPVKALLLEKKAGAQLCVVTAFNATSCYNGDFSRKTIISERGTSFKQTLIYSGRVGNKIKIAYREFSNSLARPAFSNDVEYDLSISNVIGYKGSRIEVINSDNSSITYRLLKNFSE